jgi:dihydroflavonol-4-reductase
LSVERVVGDVLEPDTLKAATAGVKWVFHTATRSDYWRHPEQSMRTILEGTRNVMQTAVEFGVQRVVFTSSQAALGVPRHDQWLTEENTFNLPSKQFPYGYAKHCAEIEARQIAEQGTELVILLPAATLGPGDINRISGSMVIEAARGWGFFWFDGGTNYIHVQDVVAGHLAAAQAGHAGERYILGGQNLSHHEAFRTITQVVGKRDPWLKIPNSMIEPLAKTIDLLRPILRLPFDTNQLRIARHFLFCDTSKAQRELGFVAQHPFRETIQETYDWYKDIGIL